MAKRFNALKEFGRTSKKPKLDISINNKNRPSTSNDRENIHSLLRKEANAINDLWDDDEDDVILLATQVAESEIAATKSKQNMEITESEITFSEFQPRIQQHSTQRPTEPQTDLLSQMFDDDDDFARLVAVAEKESKKYLPTSAQLFDAASEPEVFKKPDLPTQSKVRSNRTDVEPKVDSDSNMLSRSVLDPSVEARRQLATERQVQFLMERLEALKEENAKLNNDLNDIKDNMQAKTGEASMLRDELRRSKKQMENLKVEKLFHNETMNAESKSKIEQLSKEIKAKESQLQLKNIECSVLKMRHADENRRFEMSMREPIDEAGVEDAIMTEEKDLRKMFSMIRLRKLNIKAPPKLIESKTTFVTKNTFERAVEHGVPKKIKTFLQQEIENLQRILSQLQLQPDIFDSQTSQKLTESVGKVFSKFRSYVDKLQYGFHDKLLPYHDYDVMEDKSKRSHGCLHSNIELYDGERCLNLRRYIACLSAICQQSSDAARIIIATNYKGDQLLKISIDAVNKMGFSSEVSAHLSIIEAYAILTRSILLHLQSELEEDKPFLELTFCMLKHLVFTRPSPWALLQLSFSVLDCAERLSYVLSMFCVNSPRTTFIADRSKSIYRFSNDSCFLQVYCGLMEAAYPLYRQLSKTHFEVQCQLCFNHVRFVFNCLTEPPHFVSKMLPCDEDDESDDRQEQNNLHITKKVEENAQTSKFEAPSTSKQATVPTMSGNSGLSNSTINASANSSMNGEICDCFTQMCLSVVTIIWLTLRQWLRFEKKDQTKRVGHISRIAVHLLYIIFCDNYLPCLFRECENTTKYYLYLIWTYWSENSAELKFNDIQISFLQKLKDCHAIPKTLNEHETKLENIESDLAQWRQMTNDDACDSTKEDSETIVKKLRLIDDAFNPELFFARLNRGHLNLQTFEDA